MKLARARVSAFAFIMRAVFILLPAALAACQDTSDDGAVPADIVTLFDIQRLGPAGLLPDGSPVQESFAVSAAGLTLNVAGAFSEGLPAAYVAAEQWFNVPRVWVQPMYVVGTDVNGAFTPLPGQLPIFSVGPDSGFYSPFWQVFFVTAPAGTAPNTYRSSAQVFNDGLPMTEGPGRLCVLAPDGVDITGYVRGGSGMPDVPPPHPFSWQTLPAVGRVARAEGWVDGRPAAVKVLAFGDHKFRWDDNLVVEETALFLMKRKTAQGTVATGLPAVGGTGPLFSGVPPRFVGERPTFGSLWRMADVFLPDSAGALVPDMGAPAATRLAELGLKPRVLPAALANDPDPASLYFRPILDVACLEGPDPRQGCVFLDRQSTIERHLPNSVASRDVLVTCPLVSYAARPVPL